MCILCTVPSIVPSKLDIKSPLETCLKNKIKIPLARFAKLPCNAKPTATPAVPKIVTSEVAFIPIIPIIIKAKAIYIRVFIKDFKNDISKGSLCLNVIAFSRVFSKNFVILGHIKQINKKAIIFPASIGK